MTKKKYLILFIIITFFVLIQRINNTLKTNIYDFDEGGHAKYIEYVSKNWKTPLPNENWQFYHPPLYYFFLAIPLKILNLLNNNHHFNLKIIQFTSLFFYMSLSVITILTIIRLNISQSEILLIIYIFNLLIPVNIYMSRFITNENFFIFIFHLIYYFLILFFLENSNQKKIKLSVLLAILCSISLLIKYTGLIIIIIYFIILVFEIFKNRNNSIKYNWLKILFLYIILIFIFNFKFYLRNYKLYKNFFVTNINDELPNFLKLSDINQGPGYRSWKNFFNFSLYFFVNCRANSKNMINCVWQTIYSSYWFDSQSLFFQLKNNKIAIYYGRIILLLSILPSLIILFGFFYSYKYLNKEIFFFSFLFIFLTIIFFIRFTFIYPVWSALKASYFSFLNIIFSLYFFIGIYHIKNYYKKLYNLFIINFSFLFLFIYFIFWK
ncbi:MAG TPA: hypothetical protein PK189_03865 [bacterium]|nr:hypothetical protein [bacterium]